MSFQVLCECGKTSNVCPSQAGTTVDCVCGRNNLVPPLSRLQRSAEDSEPTPLDDSRPGGHQSEKASPPREFVMLLAEEEDLDARIHAEAFHSFLAACERTVQDVFAGICDTHGFDLQVACALLPNGEKIIECQTSCGPTSDEIDSLVDALRRLQSPPVANGPVPFVFRVMVNGGADDAAQLYYPFSHTLAGRQGMLDDLLMEAGGMPRVLTHYKRLRAWWARLRSWLLGVSTHAIAGYSTAECNQSDSFPEALQEQYSESELTDLIDADPNSYGLYGLRGDFRLADGDLAGAMADYGEIIRLRSEDPRAYYARANAALMSGNTADALADLNRALQLDPQFTEGRSSRASIYLELGAWDKAVEDLGVAIEGDKRSPSLRVLRARAYCAMEDYQQALADLTSAIELDPHHAEALSLRGFLRSGFIRDGGQDVDAAIDEAIHDLDAALRMEPNSSITYAHRAHAFLLKQNFAQAAADCDRAIALDAECGSAYAIRGLACHARGMNQRAITDCTKAIELDISASNVYLGRAVAHANDGEIESALADVQAILAAEPQNIEALHLRGTIRLTLELVAEAIEDFSTVVKIEPTCAEAYAQRGNAYRMQGEVELAMSDYTRAIELEATAVAHANRALCWKDQRQLDKALDDLNAAVQLQPDFLAARFERAHLLHKFDQDESALSDLAEVLRLAPDFLPAYFVRAAVYTEMGELDEAVADFDAAIRLSPSMGWAYSGRANVWIQKREHEKAAADYQEAIQCDPGAAEQYVLQKLVVEAHCHHREEEFAAAIAKATEAIDLDPQYIPAYAVRASAHWYAEEFVKAVEDHARWIDVAGESFSALMGRGQVYAEMGEFEAALADLNRAIEMGEGAEGLIGLAFAYNGRGFALAGLERYEEAKRDFARSISACPDNAWVHYNQGLMFHKLGQEVEARDCFQHALTLDQPALTPRKRERAEGFIARISDEARSTRPQNSKAHH